MFEEDLLGMGEVEFRAREIFDGEYRKVSREAAGEFLRCPGEFDVRLRIFTKKGADHLRMNRMC